MYFMGLYVIAYFTHVIYIKCPCERNKIVFTRINTVLLYCVILYLLYLAMQLQGNAFSMLSSNQSKYSIPESSHIYYNDYDGIRECTMQLVTVS